MCQPFARISVGPLRAAQSACPIMCGDPACPSITSLYSLRSKVISLTTENLGSGRSSTRRSRPRRCVQASAPLVLRGGLDDLNRDWSLIKHISPSVATPCLEANYRVLHDLHTASRSVSCMRNDNHLSGSVAQNTTPTSEGSRWSTSSSVPSGRRGHDLAHDLDRDLFRLSDVVTLRDPWHNIKKIPIKGKTTGRSLLLPLTMTYIIPRFRPQLGASTRGK